MNATLESDLKRCADMMSSKWSIQNKDMDNVTKFIYNSETLNDCLSEANTKKLSDEARNYALHRWFNFKTSIYCEELFCDYGAIHDEDQYNHDVDIYINNIPFDVKLTVYPAKLSNKPYDLTTRSGKNKMIKWYYANQSQQNRKQLLNRLYVVCDGATNRERQLMKCNFDLIRRQINLFMEYVNQNGFNEIEIIDEGKSYKLYSDIIYIH